MGFITADENEPLLLPTSTGVGNAARGRRRESVALDFDPKGDPENPLEWPTAFKWSIVALLALMAFTVTFTCISIVPIASQIAADLASESDGQPQKAASVLLVTIWELGEAVGPFVIAPLSESHGRAPVLHAATTLFVLTTLLAAMARSTGLFVFTRALTGLAVATNVLCPAIIGDMFGPDSRGSPMSAIMLAPLLGGAIGPAIGGAVAERIGWRAVVFMSAALAGGCEIMFLVFYRETYKPVILRKRYRTEGSWTWWPSTSAAGLDQAIIVPDVDTEATVAIDDVSSTRKMWEAVMRPAVVFFGSPILQALALFGSIVFSYFYIMAVTLADILQDRYGLSPALAGTAFLSFSIGSSLSVFICNRAVDKIYITMRASHGGEGRPEFRMPLTVVGALMLPAAVALYGWTAELRLPLPVLLLSVGLIGASILIGWIPLIAYVVDAFGLYAASAMTGMIVLRCLMGTFLPLSTPILIESCGYGWGMTVFSAVSLLMVPIPALVMRYGARWRQGSVYSKDT